MCLLAQYVTMGCCSNIYLYSVHTCRFAEYLTSSFLYRMCWYNFNKILLNDYKSKYIMREGGGGEVVDYELSFSD